MDWQAHAMLITLAENFCTVHALLACTCSLATVRMQIAGLDVGWGQRIDLEKEARTGRFVTERALPAGKFPYKLVFDETLWTCSADHPTMLDGEHLNNFVEVLGNTSAAAVEARLRLMSADGNLTAGERQTLRELFVGGALRLVNKSSH